MLHNGFPKVGIMLICPRALITAPGADEIFHRIITYLTSRSSQPLYGDNLRGLSSLFGDLT